MPYYYIYARNQRGRTSSRRELDCSDSTAARVIAKTLLDEDIEASAMEIWERGTFLDLIDRK